MRLSPISTALSAIDATSERLRSAQVVRESGKDATGATDVFNIRTSNLDSFDRYVERIWNRVDDLGASFAAVPLTLLLRNINCKGFINYEFRPRPETPNIDSLHISVSGMTLPNWSFYCIDSPAFQLYRGLIENISKAAYPKTLHSNSDDILQFEAELARRVLANGITSTSIKKSEFFEFSRAHDTFSELFNSRCLSFLRRIAPDDGLVLVSPAAFGVLVSYLTEVSTSLIQDWLKFKLVLGLVEFGPEVLVSTKSAFFETIYDLRPGHFSIDRLDASAFRKIYDKRIALTFKEEFGGSNLVEEVSAIFDRCRNAVFSVLTREVGAEKDVKQFVESKLDSMTIEILPAVEESDRINLQDCCDFIDWMIHSSGILSGDSARAVSSSSNRKYYTIPAASCSCFYRAESNEIEVGAGCLHPAIIGGDLYRGVAMSPLSFMIAHEIGHAFDSNCLETAVPGSTSVNHDPQVGSCFEEFYGRIRTLAYRATNVNYFRRSIVDDGLNEIIADCIAIWSHREMLCNESGFAGGVPDDASTCLSSFLNPLWVDLARFESNRSDHHPPAEFRRAMCRELV
ncbi:hypothetical protein [Corynebacterium falsenii]|uniref:hypothetical protein n=1 Tax=Corynebacterium falsenii TaxID=108486 RepID=UPI003FCFBAB5